jgi:hypothetical protein
LALTLTLPLALSLPLALTLTLPLALSLSLPLTLPRRLLAALPGAGDIVRRTLRLVERLSERPLQGGVACGSAQGVGGSLRVGR